MAPLLLPQIEFVVWEWLEEFRSDTELAPHCPEFSFAFADEWDQLSDWCFAASDRDHLPSLYSRDKLREVGFGGVIEMILSIEYLSLAI